MDYDFVIRAGAVVAASVLAAPRLVAAVRRASSLLPTAAKENAPAQDSLTKDAHTVLEIAQRLRAAGLNKGVDLCKQLLDVMIGGSQK